MQSLDTCRVKTGRSPTRRKDGGWRLIAVYTPLEYNRAGNQTLTQEMIQILNTMWDNKPMIDEPYETTGIYQTFKTVFLRTYLQMNQSRPDMSVQDHYP